ncbi:hypothetical protein [Paenibacillus taichungensis]|jgi:hypothetical protein
MDNIYVFFYTVIVILLVIWWLLDYFLFRPHKTSNVLNALFGHFMERNERPVEFRIIESKAKRNTREFELKTIHQKYYTVVIKGLKVLSTERIDSFTISEEDSYMRGVIDPVRLNSFTISVKEFIK